MDVYRIPEGQIATLDARLAKLNARADKLGVDPITYTASDPIEVRDPDTGLVIGYAVDVTLSATTIRLAGWTFAATIEHTDAGNLIRTAPGFDIDLPADYRDAAATCDHCRTNRDRNDTYVVHSDDEGFKRVGRNCLADFTGHSNPINAVRFEDDLRDLLDDLDGWSGGATGPVLHSFREAVMVAHAVIRQDGHYVSRSKAFYGDTATADIVAQRLAPPRGKAGEQIIEQYPVDEDRDDVAEAVRAWADGEFDGGTDFDHNMTVVARQDVIDPARHLGYLAYLVHAFLGYQQKQRERAEKADAPAGRREVVGTVVRVHRYEGYGYYDPPTFKMTVQADDGGYTVFTTIPKAIRDEVRDEFDLEGARVRFTATLVPQVGQTNSYGEAKDDDPTHAKGTRPSKAALLEPVSA